MSVLDDILAGLNQDIEKTASDNSEQELRDLLANSVSSNTDASADGAAFAQELVKQAFDANSQTNEVEMQNSVEARTLALVNSVMASMEKSAAEFNPDNAVAEGTAPNQTTIANAQMVAEQVTTAQPAPVGTVNQILSQLSQKAVAQGGVTEQQLEDGGQESGERQDENVEKVAAVDALVAEGFDFDSAVALVKEASFEIEAEEDEMAKEAAVGELVDAGIDLFTAVALVKEASEGAGPEIGAARRAGRKAANAGRAFADEASNAASAAKGLGKSPRFALQSLAGNRVVQGAGALAAVGGIAYGAKKAFGREKKAALDDLMAQGVDFDSAIAAIYEATGE